MLGEVDPGGDVGLVVDGRDDYLIARLEAQRGGEVAKELGCRRTQDCIITLVSKGGCLSWLMW